MKRIKAKQFGHNIVGPAVRKLRYQAKLSQPDLAARCQVAGWENATRDVIATIEGQRRNVNDKEVLWLAKALRVNYTALFPKS